MNSHSDITPPAITSSTSKPNQKRSTAAQSPQELSISSLKKEGLEQDVGLNRGLNKVFLVLTGSYAEFRAVHQGYSDLIYDTYLSYVSLE